MISCKNVHIVTNLYTGGAEMMLYKLLSHINRERFEPIVVSLMDEGTLGDCLEALDISVYTINMKRGLPTIPSFWQLIHTLSQIQPDLIQGWMYHGNLAAQLTSYFLHTSISVSVLWNIRHSLYSLDYERARTRFIIQLSTQLSNFPQKVIYNSRVAASQHESIGYCHDNTVVIPNGFDTEKFAPSSGARMSVRKELRISINTILIGLIGRYHSMKDHDNFLQAAASLRKHCPDIDIQFLLVGRGVNWDNQHLYKLIKELGLTEKIHLLGERKDIPRLSAALDIAASASYSEAFPNVIGEAMSCGVPCVVTDVGDSAWIVGNTGRIVPPRNPQLLARGWKELIDMGAEPRKALGKAARDRIIGNFSLGSVVAQYESLYENVLARKLKEKS